MKWNNSAAHSNNLILKLNVKQSLASLSAFRTRANPLTRSYPRGAGTRSWRGLPALGAGYPLSARVTRATRANPLHLANSENDYLHGSKFYKTLKN